jgi:hypothetical protein
VTALGKEMKARLPVQSQLTRSRGLERFVRAVPITVLLNVAVGSLILRLAMEGVGSVFWLPAVRLEQCWVEMPSGAIPTPLLRSVNHRCQNRKGGRG